MYEKFKFSLSNPKAACVGTSLCFWIGFLCSMFWGKDSLPKIAKKHHTVSSYCSCVEDMRLVGVSDDPNPSVNADFDPSDSHGSEVRKRLTKNSKDNKQNHSVSYRSISQVLFCDCFGLIFLFTPEDQ